MPRASDLGPAYRRRVAALRAEVERRLVALYGNRIDPEDITASFETFIADAEALITAGQASAAALAEAYLASRAARADVELALDDLSDDVIGTTRAGEPLVAGMAAFAPMVLGQIGDGRPVDEAIDYGRFVAARFADAEVTGTIDRIDEDPVVRSQLVGWEGTVQPGACDGCQENAGTHELDWTPYRHGYCNCVVEPVFGDAAG